MSVELRDSMCFGCSPQNPIGLKLKFIHDGDICRSYFTGSREHEGWPGIMHGGLLTTLLDEVMAQWLYERDIMAMTVEINVKFSKPVPIGQQFAVEGKQESKKGRLIVLEGQVLLSDGTVATKATAKFIQVKNSI
ncbi:thioesterase superfamily protein [Desulfofarcimen acetoxidans DSM 771]|uniref:Acyl-coenzyme A thioesterase THEM4 n=1 Tax=Desulfofarcimen acetoxidans (strain ATCC 49208 / DSM 771 / KCTC 5769 / VKM B-1644 / 5575) TaxID=485916 RepID=C8VXZ4_DESAS|nr:PaaI family thioesterase [Desulfofarcimen acetoxidans]ACV64623.1 thioesterase superfamily protein [Desulfofarcimen acetoxidans DSM 771]